MQTYQIKGTLDDLDAQLPALWDAGCSGMYETGDYIHAYFDTITEIPIPGEWLPSDTTNWLEQWKAGLNPVTVENVTIVPSWLKEQQPQTSLTLVIDPGMAFGTGHHQTTRFAIAALQALNLKDQKVLDVGAGTGILALVAAGLGAEAYGVDIDPITVPIARDNAALNNLNAHFIEGLLQDALSFAPFDVLVCNLFAELHDSLAGEYVEALKPQGDLILTGILLERLPLVHAALEREGFENVTSQSEGEWVLVTATAPSGLLL